MKENRLVFLLIVLATLSANGGWELVNPVYTASELNDIFYTRQNEAWVAGNDGILMHTVSSGDTWEIVQTPGEYPAPLRSIVFTSLKNGFAAGGTDSITYALMTSDSGKTWVDVSDKFPPNGIVKIYAQKSGRIWVVTNKVGKCLYYSDDNGESWTLNAPEETLIKDICFIDDSTGIVCGDNGYIGRSSDSGTSWHRVSSGSEGNYAKLSFPDSNTGFCLEESGLVQKTVNGGQQWNTVLESEYAMEKFRHMHFINTREGFVWTDYSGGWITRDGGESWDVVSKNLHYKIKDVAFPRGYVGLAVTDMGSILRVNGLFVSTEDLSYHNFYAAESYIDFYSPSGGICGVTGSTYLVTADSGKTWQKQSSRIVLYDELTAFSRDRVVLDNAMGGPVYCEDTVFTWKSVPDQKYWQSFYKLPYTDTVFSAVDDTIYFSGDAGETWAKQGISSLNAYVIHFCDSEVGFISDYQGNIVRTNDKGVTWNSISSLPVNTTVGDMCFHDKDTGWIAALTDYVPVIYRTFDGGDSWQSVSSFEFHPQFENDGAFKQVRSVDSRRVWVLRKNAILYSGDGGLTWKQQIIPQFGTSLNQMYVHKDGRVYVVGSKGRIWKYEPGSQNSAVRYQRKEICENMRIVVKNRVIEFDFSSLRSSGRLIVYNIHGRVVFERPISSGIKEGIRITGLPAGVYLTRLQLKKRIKSGVFIVK